MTVQQNFYLNIFEEQIDYFTLKWNPDYYLIGVFVLFN
jgi:hypothetical protein